jgi:hypothetical protein
MKTAWADQSLWCTPTYGGFDSLYLYSDDGSTWSTKNYRDLPFRFITGFTESGVFISEVFDAGQLVDWEFIEWDATRPPGTGISFYIRTGDSPELAGSWTGPFENGRGDLSGLRSSRYLQYKIEFTARTGGTIGPAVHEVRVGYLGGFGSIRLHTGYRRYQPQTWVYEGGAVILAQDENSVMRSEPELVEVEDAGGNNLKVTVDYIFLKRPEGLEGLLMPTAESITVHAPDPPVYTVRPDGNTPNRSQVEVEVVSEYPDAWRGYFEGLSRSINRAHGAGVSSVDISEIGEGVVKLLIYGKGTGDDILYYERVRELEVRVAG